MPYFVGSLILFFLTLTQGIYGQQYCKLRGSVIDRASQLSVADAVVQIGTQKMIASDARGCFECVLEAGDYLITVKHIAYEKKQFTVRIERDTTLVLSLSPDAHVLHEAVVKSAGNSKGISGILGGRVELDMEALKVLPKFIGNNDPLKILQLTPGVQTASEGEAGIFVRGGENGHNLIVWNDAPIYNASHLLGSFSIFNTGHIGKFKLYKSNIGAEYGGRLSSIISVESPEKIPERISVSGSLGLIASQATLSLPIKQKYALYLSARKTYIGLALKPLLKSMMDGKGEDAPYDYEFQDVNFSFIACPTKKDKIVVNGYWGADRLEVGEPDYAIAGNMKWSNLAGSIQWKRELSSRTRMKHSFFASRYSNQVDMTQSEMAFRLPSSIVDLGYRNSFDMNLGIHQLKSGADYVYHTIRPQVPQIKMDSLGIGSAVNPEFYTHEFGLYLSDNIRVMSDFWIEVGVRYSANLQTGRYDDLKYSSQGTLVDSVHYGKGEKVSYRQGLEPRIAFNYTLPFDGLLQLSYNRIYQFIDLISISGVGLPTDFWIPASRNIPPQRTDNFSAGYFQSVWKNTIEFSVEGYYRRMTCQTEYDNAIMDLLNQKYILEQSLLYGEGKAYGAEFMLKNNGDKWNGWISYTLGWSKRRFPDIENGRIFPAKHDRRHDLSVVVSYAPNRKWDFSSVFVYATGNAYTQPMGMHVVGGNPVKEYGHYNGARLPDYHRLDVSANYWFFKEKDRESGLNLSVYNVYRRKNPLYIFVVAKKSDSGNNQIVVKKKYKRLYDLIPSISWTFKF